MNKVVWLAIMIGIALVGCGPAVVTPDSGSDAGAGPDAHVQPDAFVPTDALPGDDAFLAPDGGADAFVATDGGTPLPAIIDDTAHAVPASADGHDRYYAVAFADDSSFYVAGNSAPGVAATDDFSTVVAHFGADGALDTTFGTGGFFRQNLAVGTSGELVGGIGLQSDGSIVVSATIEHVEAGVDARDRDAVVFRLTPAGVLDATFGDAGLRVLDLSDGVLDGTAFRADGARTLAIDSTDRIVMAAQRVRDGALDLDWAMVRLTVDGDLDAAFATAGVFSLDLGMVGNTARGVSVLADGSIIGAGYYTPGTPAGAPVVPVMYKLDDSGDLVTAFSTDGIYEEAVLLAQAEVYGVGVQSDGSLVTAGYGRDDGPGDNDFISIRVDGTTGVRDLTYGNNGALGYMLLTGFDFGDNARGVLRLPDDRVLMHGQLRTDATNQDAAVVILTADGVPDTTFDTDGVSTTDFGGPADHFWSAAVDPTGQRIVVVGIASYPVTAPVTDDDGAIWLFEVP